jgi:nucleotide-binding universal stress UspA family protein
MINGQKKIMIAVDGSDQALGAVRYVSEVLSPGRIKVVLFHVTTNIPESFWDLKDNTQVREQILSIGAWKARQDKAIRDFMEKARSVLSSSGFASDAVAERVQERTVGIARDIAAEAQQGYDAVVIGRKGMGELEGLVFGSVANKVIERVANVPVWVIGEGPKTGKVLVAIDASEGSMRAVDYVGSMLSGSDAEVALIHTIRSFDIFQFGAGSGQDGEWSEKAGKELQKVEEEMQVFISNAKSRLIESGLKPERVTGRIASNVATRAGCIIEEARNGGYGTIVVGRRGLSRVEEFFMGRVSNKILQMAKDMAVWVIS